jgi:hypothetical protein
MTQRNTVQKDSSSSPAIAAQTVPQGADSFNQPSDTHLQAADSFSRQKVWNKTGKDNLVRHKSGGYYARVYAKGKEVWKSLKTSHYSVAKARLAEFLKDHRQRSRGWWWRQGFRRLGEDDLWRSRDEASAGSG